MPSNTLFTLADVENAPDERPQAAEVDPFEIGRRAGQYDLVMKEYVESKEYAVSIRKIRDLIIHEVKLNHSIGIIKEETVCLKVPYFSYFVSYRFDGYVFYQDLFDKILDTLRDFDYACTVQNVKNDLSRYNAKYDEYIRTTEYIIDRPIKERKARCVLM